MKNIFCELWIRRAVASGLSIVFFARTLNVYSSVPVKDAASAATAGTPPEENDVADSHGRSLWVGVL